MKKIIPLLLMIMPSTLFAQTITMTAPSSNPISATLNVPLSFTCQVSAPPAGRIWGTGVIKHYSQSGGDMTVATFTLSSAFQSSGGTVTANATFTHNPPSPHNNTDNARCLFKTGNGYNTPYQSTHKPVNLSPGVPPPPDTTAPSVPTGLAVSNITSSSMLLAWTASTASDIQKYQIQRYNSSNTLLATTDVNAPTVTLSVTGLIASTQYKYKIRACDTSSNCSAYTSTYVSATTSAAPPADTTAPTFPSNNPNLVVTGTTSNSVSFSWTAASDVNFQKYEIKNVTLGSVGATFTSISTTTGSVSGLSASTPYTFQIRACDTFNNCSAYKANATANSTVGATTTAASSAPPVVGNYYGSQAAVQLSATTQTAPASITLQWATVTNRSVSSIAIYRKTFASTSWGASIANPSSSATSYTDTGVSANTLYEYKVVINGTATGYIASGINVNVDEYKGKILLVVSSNVSSSLTNELKTLRRDLYGDGWIPLAVQTVSQSATPASVKTLIQSARTANPDLKAVYLIGHVPVPYAGNNNPDGHGNGRVMGGDGYYSELTSTWSGSSGCSNAPEQATLNDTPNSNNMICNPTFPSTVELQSGRVDMYNLPAFSMTETSLIQNYLSKAHSFKIKQIVPQKRALIKDVFNSNGWTNSAATWGTLPSLVGANNVTADNSNYPTGLMVNNQSYLFNYGANFGASCAGSNGDIIGSTAVAASVSWDAVFNMVWGSYFGEYNCQNNFLRGILGSNGDSLATVYNSHNWFFHRMAMGQTIGDSVVQTMNNGLNVTYTPYKQTVTGSSSNTYESLMGDPSLRMEYILPPSNLVTTATQLSWTASAEAGVTGYHVYEVLGSNITRLTSSPQAGTTYSTTTTGRSFIVRAVKLVSGNSGSYYLPSVGIITPALVP
jgi:hypothetical protein